VVVHRGLFVVYLSDETAFARVTALGRRLRVCLDGQPPGASAGIDVNEDGDGLLRDGRLYQLIRRHDRVREQTLEITFLEHGAEAYAFTFG
jgi:hypothetical protein